MRRIEVVLYTAEELRVLQPAGFRRAWRGLWNGGGLTLENFLAHASGHGWEFLKNGDRYHGE